MLYNVTYQVENDEQSRDIAGLPDQSDLSVVVMNCFVIGCSASVVSVDGTCKFVVDNQGKVTPASK